MTSEQVSVGVAGNGIQSEYALPVGLLVARQLVVVVQRATNGAILTQKGSLRESLRRH